MMANRTYFFVAVLGVLLFGSIVKCAAVQQKPVEIGIDEHLGGTLPMDAEFFDEKGYLVSLKDVIKKPTILCFVYYRCPGICTPLLTELTTVVNKLDMEIGKEYQIVTISFDENDKSDVAAAKKENYFSLVKKEVPGDAWKFLTGDSATIQTVTRSAGFMFKRNGNDFIHAATIIAVSPEGKIARYLYGTQFLPLDVKLALVEASEGKTGPTIAKLLSYCYSYNPEGRTYVFNITRIFGVGILTAVVLFVVYVVAKPKKIERS